MTAVAEKTERERIAAEQAAENARLAAERKKLEEERAAVEAERAKQQAIIDEQNRIAAAKLEEERKAIEAKRLKLEREEFERQAKAKAEQEAETLGGKWSRKAKAHTFDGDAAQALEAIIETGEYQSATDIKQLHGEFFTPDGLADEVVKLAEIDPQGEVLEPSCGNGQLIRAIDRLYPPSPSRADSLMSVTGVEIQEKHRKALCDLAVSFDIADFLGLSPDSPCDGTRLPYGQYDRIVMNPPFAKQADIDHVLHAWKFLKDGGRLVSIMSPGWTFRENAKSRDFRNFVAQHGEWKWNPDESFKESGTLIKTVMVVLNKD